MSSRKDRVIDVPVVESVVNRGVVNVDIEESTIVRTVSSTCELILGSECPWSLWLAVTSSSL